MAEGTAVIGQKLHEGVLGEDAVRRLEQTVREDHTRCQRLLQVEQQKFLDRLSQRNAETVQRLRGHAAALACMADAA